MEILTVLGVVLAGVWTAEVCLYLGLYLAAHARPDATKPGP